MDETISSSTENSEYLPRPAARWCSLPIMSVIDSGGNALSNDQVANANEST